VRLAHCGCIHVASVDMQLPEKSALAGNVKLAAERALSNGRQSATSIETGIQIPRKGLASFNQANFT
jgi:hypothetical protein